MPSVHDERATELPLFSVVIPCYNAEATLARAVRSCFTQDERSLELILVDDGSSDATPALMAALAAEAPAGLPVRCHHMPANGGPSRARNQGWDMAQGRYIAFLDADDCWDADRLRRIREVLTAAGDEVVLLGHPHRQLGEVRADAPVCVSELSPWRVLLRNPAQTSCVVVRRQLPLRFDAGMRYAEDHDLWARVARLGRVLYLPGLALTCLGRPQLSAGGLSERRWAMRQGELRMYIKAAGSDGLILACLPMLLVFSLVKHAWSTLRLALTSRGVA